MQPIGWGRRIRGAFEGRLWQSLAIAFCVLFGIAMIVNVQLSGEAWWFYYARLLHSGTRLYADLHLPLQPLKVLETDVWMQLFGTKILVTEVPSVIHALVFALAMFLILRESDWPDWQKAIVLASAFLTSIDCVAYRFDDFHIVTDTFTFYSVVLLLLLAKADAARRQFALAAGLGILSGLAITTRLNDGGALLVSAVICLMVLARTRKLLLAGLVVVVAAAMVILVVKLTGDSFSDYISNTIIRAAGAKGGTGSILAAPFHLFITAFRNIRGQRWLFYWTVGIVAGSAALEFYWKSRFRYLVALQLGMAGFAYIYSSWLHRVELRDGMFFSFAAYSSILIACLLPSVVAAHYLISKMGDGKRGWDSREILILVPLAELASFSTSNGGAIASFLSPVALLFLLLAVILPSRRQTSWVNSTLVMVMALMGPSTIAKKIQHPYDWQYFRASPMFEGREWYQHPVYGPMYIEKDELNFILPICREIGAGNSKPELLSMPFSYPNYLCGAPLWHNYVQTFYDTTTDSTMRQLIRELDTAPPRWIVYQRQMVLVKQAEKLFHKGQPMAQRDLDNLIMHKLATGQWQLVSRSYYLYAVVRTYSPGDGWYIIRTRP